MWHHFIEGHVRGYFEESFRQEFLQRLLMKGLQFKSNLEKLEKGKEPEKTVPRVKSSLGIWSLNSMT